MALGRSAVVGPAPELLRVEGLAWPVELRVHPRARRLRLAIDDRRERLRLTCPPRLSRRAALKWAGEQRGWVDRQIGQREAPIRLVPGAVIPFDGGERRLEWVEGATRTVGLTDETIACGGPLDGYERRIGRWLKAEALRRLSEETADIASRAGIRVAAVAVGDAGTRWGSCSADGRIRFNWRLLLAPPEVRRYVVAHEVAHRRHMDHGAAFHAFEAELFGGSTDRARRKLRRLSALLRRVRL
ncbi:SprT family zinc-dependent metalloprotease [Sphingomonas sp. ASV193]|uniref:M48 family metallopeptidase n=1 Tax=Sphingomonas sp. ASV193 TaxID=3144405 RepID=UPI0032E937F2